MKRPNICIADPMQQRVVSAVRQACKKQRVGCGLDIQEIANILDLDLVYTEDNKKAYATVQAIGKQFELRHAMYGELFGNVDKKYVIAQKGTELYLALIQRGTTYSLKQAAGYHKKAENLISKIV